MSGELFKMMAGINMVHVPYRGVAPGVRARIPDRFLVRAAVPRNTPAEIFGVLNREINATIADPKLKSRFAEIGVIPVGGTPMDFGALIADEIRKWAKVIEASGARAD